MINYYYGGMTDVGLNRELNEDYINIEEVEDEFLFVAIADGAGSKNGNMLQPASIAIREVSDILRREYKKAPDVFRENAKLFLYEAIMTANRILSAFKIANEELYAGFGSTLTVCLLFENKRMVFGHIGNNQLLLLRQNKARDTYIPKVLTAEQTKAADLLNEGIIREEQFWTHPDRMVINGALGLYTDPVIQIFDMQLKDNDFIILTTDGIHYAIRPEIVGQIVIESGDCDSAVSALIRTAKTQNYSDNMSAIVVFNTQAAQ